MNYHLLRNGINIPRRNRGSGNLRNNMRKTTSKDGDTDKLNLDLRRAGAAPFNVMEAKLLENI
jgi:hypothetical protein